jgi:hypothetical protein
MGEGREDELVAALARRAVASAAPAELPLFRATSRAYFDDPKSLLAARPSADDMLGFGPGEAALLLTPVALDVARRVVDFVLDHVRATAEAEAGAAVDGATARLLHRIGVGDEPEPAPDAPPDAPLLSPEQLQEVRRVALEKARQMQLPEATADLLADSLVGGLSAG